MIFVLKSLMAFWRRRAVRRLLQRRVNWSVWRRVVCEVPVVARLTPRERGRLRLMSGQFLERKALVGEAGFELDAYQRAVIAAQACLLVLNLDLGYYDGWHEVIVYPNTFTVPMEALDEAGVMQQSRQRLSGEAWGRGPIILSWESIQPHEGGSGNSGLNVVLHEFAHKLDMLNGSANGMPPLHSGMHPKSWSEDFNRAYSKLLKSVQHGRHLRIDPYAVESPGEFFAVVTEFFFERPAVLQDVWPQVYAQLSAFYRQDPLKSDSA